MKAHAEKFKVNPKYYDVVPRPSKEERRALDLGLIDKGQLEPIVVNPQMVVLDGHTRFELLQARGKMIKYVIRKFTDDEEEYDYVLETNLMRRHLNQFQRIESVYNKYKKLKKETHDKDYTSQLKVLQAIKKGFLTSPNMQRETGYHRFYINKVLLGLIKDHCVRRESEFKKYENGKGRGGTTYYVYSILPKGEERLSKMKPKKKGGVNIMIGKIINVNRNNVSRGVWLIEHASSGVLKQLREGKIGIEPAYHNVQSNVNYMPSSRKECWNRYDNIKCNHCGHIAKKTEYTKIDRDYVPPSS